MLLADQLKSSLQMLAKLETLLPRAFTAGAEEGECAAYANLPRADAPLESAPTLEELIAEIGPLPPHAIVIGACADHSHLFLDLTDPRPGSILITGDIQCGKTRLLRSILLSAARLNPARRVRYALITSRFPEAKPLLTHTNCYKVFAAHAEQAPQLLLEMADLVEQRQAGQPISNAILFAIDDLMRLLEALEASDTTLIEQLRWLIRNGPEMQVWTIATLNAPDLDQVAASVLDAFQTRLVGRTESAETAAALVGGAGPKVQELTAGSQFGLVFGEQWMPFWTPLTETEPDQESRYEYRNAVVR